MGPRLDFRTVSAVITLVAGVGIGATAAQAVHPMWVKAMTVAFACITAMISLLRIHSKRFE